MYIDLTTQKRVNIYAPYKGFSKLDTPEVRVRVGVVEIDDPQPPMDYSEETYYRNEQDDAPYVVFTRKSEEQLTQLAKAKAQAQIDVLDGGHPTARPLREFALGVMEKIATDAGVSLEDLRAANFGYRKMKELDEEVVRLRAQL